MLFSTPGQFLLLAQERASRMLLLERRSSKAAAPIARSLDAPWGHCRPPCDAP